MRGFLPTWAASTCLAHFSQGGCTFRDVGALVLGGKVPDTIPAKLWIPYTGGSSYTVQLVDIQIGTRSVGCAASRYVSTIVDSGTTFMYLPPDAYRPIRDHFRLHCPWGACTSRTAKGEYPDDYCYSMSLSEHSISACANKPSLNWSTFRTSWV